MQQEGEVRIDAAEDVEVNRMEVEFSRKLRSNDPAVGYNQWPQFGGA